MSDRFVCVVEWHENGWPHFHLLVESRFIPHKMLAELWGRNRPASAPAWSGSYDRSLRGQEPEFGSVFFSKRKQHTPESAANYAFKYMTKQPEDGYPEWVLSYRGQIKRYSTSRGLLPGRRRSVRRPSLRPKVHRIAGPKHDLTCFCERCRGDAVPEPQCKAVRSCVADRVARCRTKAYLAEVVELELDDGEIVSDRPRFREALGIGFADVLQLVGWEDIGQRAVPLTREDVRRVREADDPRQAGLVWCRDSVAWARRK